MRADLMWHFPLSAFNHPTRETHNKALKTHQPLKQCSMLFFYITKKSTFLTTNCQRVNKTSEPVCVCVFTPGCVWHWAPKHRDCAEECVCVGWKSGIESSRETVGQRGCGVLLKRRCWLPERKWVQLSRVSLYILMSSWLPLPINAPEMRVWYHSIWISGEKTQWPLDPSP